MTRQYECHFGLSSFLKPSAPFVTAVRHGTIRYVEERKMFPSRTIIVIAAAVIALLGCGSGTGGAPSDAAIIGSHAPTNSINTTNWTLGGVPCTLIPVPAAAPLGT